MIKPSLVPLTEPCVRASYTAPVYSYPRLNGESVPVSISWNGYRPFSTNQRFGIAMLACWQAALRHVPILIFENLPL